MIFEGQVSWNNNKIGVFIFYLEEKEMTKNDQDIDNKNAKYDVRHRNKCKIK